ncbi:ArsC/Spx/MgsR family protein [Bdellovibrio sp. KM01]|uniref:ArsC/Spx/MgsR family protein n=1 Tax=Bdellovibrio sp. KM01 TaxID=2748865 RepID=UPI0015E95F26|nr:ArsC/Spx/MgsR family protein [Bdellovibrio sp. KM01]QLY25765.1 arsenate reductase family protein [Bdellovibrio sp. KM01]
MSSWKFYHNPHCSKSREALAFLEAEAVDFKTVEYIKNPPSRGEFRELIAQMTGPLSAMVRTKDVEFTAAPFDVNSAEEVALRLSEKPQLMERPVLQGKGKAVVGRPLENIKELIKK